MSEVRRQAGARRAFNAVFTAIGIMLLIPLQAAASQLEDLVVQAGVEIVAAGSSDSGVEQQSRRTIPLSRMSRQSRDRASEVLNNTSQFRRLPEVRYSADEAMYRYLVDHPDVAVSTWRAMGISRFEMWQTGPQEYEAEAGDGSEGIADVLYRDPTQCVFICEGKYNNPLLPVPIEASALVWFRHTFSTDSSGATTVHQVGDVFVRFPSQSVSTIAKVLSPLTNTMLDRNLYEVTLYSCLMSRAVATEPEWVVQLAEHLDGVLPNRPAELTAVARQQRHGQRTTMHPAHATPMVPRDLLSHGIQFFEPPAPVVSNSAQAESQPSTSVPPVPQSVRSPVAEDGWTRRRTPPGGHVQPILVLPLKKVSQPSEGSASPNGRATGASKSK